MTMKEKLACFLLFVVRRRFLAAHDEQRIPLPLFTFHGNFAAMLMVFPVVLSLLLCLVLWLDVTRFLIPNWLNLLVFLLYPAMWLLHPSPPDALSGLACFGALFAFGYTLFAFRIMGGGDVKLLAALGLWLGITAGAMHFLLYMSIIGGILTLLLLGARKPISAMYESREQIPRLFRPREPVPYGVAIALGFLLTLWLGKVPGFEGIVV